MRQILGQKILIYDCWINKGFAMAPFLLEHTVCHLESIKLIDTADTSNKIKINHDHQLKKIVNTPY